MSFLISLNNIFFGLEDEDLKNKINLLTDSLITKNPDNISPLDYITFVLPLSISKFIDQNSIIKIFNFIKKKIELKDFSEIIQILKQNEIMIVKNEKIKDFIYPLFEKFYSNLDVSFLLQIVEIYIIISGNNYFIRDQDEFKKIFSLILDKLFLQKNAKYLVNNTLLETFENLVVIIFYSFSNQLYSLFIDLVISAKYYVSIFTFKPLFFIYNLCGFSWLLNWPKTKLYEHLNEEKIKHIDEIQGANLCTIYEYSSIHLKQNEKGPKANDLLFKKHAQLIFGITTEQANKQMEPKNYENKK